MSKLDNNELDNIITRIPEAKVLVQEIRRLREQLNLLQKTIVEDLNKSWDFEDGY